MQAAAARTWTEDKNTGSQAVSPGVLACSPLMGVPTVSLVSTVSADSIARQGAPSSHA